MRFIGRRVLLLPLILVAAALSVLAISPESRTRAAAEYQRNKAFWYQRENAAFVTLCRNSELEQMLESIKDVERQFNAKFHYDWIFLNEEEFTDEFRERISAAVSGTVKFGLVPQEHWGFPEWINPLEAATAFKKQQREGVQYGGLASYHHMCRYQSGFFYRHPLVLPYKYYWRVEPGIQIKCRIDTDVFTTMRQGNYRYGWNVAPKENYETVPGLWRATLDFLNATDYKYVAENNLVNFVTDDDSASYNLCHFWSNFEIGDADFFRSEAYSRYFDALDHAGGFFFERWGDAPVHSIAASLFLNRDEIHFFDEIGYFHAPYGHCPIAQGTKELRCDCQPDYTEFSDAIYDWHRNSCVRHYFRAKGLPFDDPNPELQ